MPFAFAGLWESWHSKETQESLQTTTIVTSAANDYLSRLHHRMPVVLEPARASRWLSGDMQLLDQVLEESPQFRAWPVDRKVNNARNESPDLIEAVGAPVT